MQHERTTQVQGLEEIAADAEASVEALGLRLIDWERQFSELVDTVVAQCASDLDRELDRLLDYRRGDLDFDGEAM